VAWRPERACTVSDSEARTSIHCCSTVAPFNLLRPRSGAWWRFSPRPWQPRLGGIEGGVPAPWRVAPAPWAGVAFIIQYATGHTLPSPRISRAAGGTLAAASTA
jgi:hypothetical protein